jgi:hypothetical protein
MSSDYNDPLAARCLASGAFEAPRHGDDRAERQGRAARGALRRRVMQPRVYRPPRPLSRRRHTYGRAVHSPDGR